MAHPLRHEPYYLHHPQPPYYSDHRDQKRHINTLFVSGLPDDVKAREIHSLRHINTLFVSGLPDDVKAREIHNLFRRYPGFDSCQLKFTGRGNQVVAFVTFFNHQAAVAALDSLDGSIFDPETGSKLHIELARSNSRRKRGPGSGPYVVIDERKKSTDDDARDTSSDKDDDEPENLSGSEENDSDDDDDNPSTTKSDERTSDPAGTESEANTEKNVESDRSPCSTLFIANLGPNCTAEELKQVLSQYPGFNVLKMSGRRGMPVAFADFEEVEQATDAMKALQGSTLPSSDRGGLSIEYAKSKMRRR